MKRSFWDIPWGSRQSVNRSLGYSLGSRQGVQRSLGCFLLFLSAGWPGSVHQARTHPPKTSAAKTVAVETSAAKVAAMKISGTTTNENNNELKNKIKKRMRS